MLDVVFILLIFFIVTSTFIQENAMASEPPPPSSPPTDADPDPAILVFIDANDSITVNRKQSDIASVRAAMERLKAENPESALIIQAHPQSSTGTFMIIRDLAYSAKMDRVNIVRSGG
jgi:biopolymer transport protein ExbD